METYQSQDRHVGKLADAVRRVYRPVVFPDGQYFDLRLLEKMRDATEMVCLVEFPYCVAVAYTLVETRSLKASIT